LTEWAGPPAKPLRYGFFLRLWDAYQGYRDGRRRIPALGAESESDSEKAPATDVVTPRLEYLRHLARDRMAAEQNEDLLAAGRLHDELAGARARWEAAEREARLAQRTWEEACRPAPEEDLKERRLAELLRQDRPDALVRARRLAGHDRKRAAAENAWARAHERLAVAALAAEALRLEIDRREAGSRARARRIHEFVSRRAAAYLQQLVRTHPRGPDLNARLHLLGPDLPSWAREPSEEPAVPDRTRGERSDGR
jgi:hypothetical protein